MVSAPLRGASAASVSVVKSKDSDKQREMLLYMFPLHVIATNAQSLVDNCLLSFASQTCAALSNYTEIYLPEIKFAKASAS
jgi:hypothetical protein